MDLSTFKDITVVSRVSAHGCSAITPRFLVYWALTRDTGHLSCVKIEIGGADCVGVATTKRACLACSVLSIETYARSISYAKKSRS